tara:strand:- start:464 stop:994 length:531 start_codon:yes stop_codon:yes gene_type:complete
MQGPVYGIYPDLENKDDRLVPSFAYDDIFGTVLNRFIVQAIAKEPLTIYGSGNQIRGYINVIDTIKCIKIALENIPQKGELKIYNQFTEQFSVLELAKLVKNSLKHINVEVEVKKITNPRIEKEKHYYNAKHSNLRRLGLSPLKLNKNIIIEIAHYCQKLSHNIDRDIIQPRVNWK